MAGTIGTERRRELIVVGRPMIAAARIQRMTRLFGAHIIVDDDTFRRVADRVHHRELGTPRLKGIKQRRTLHEVLGHRAGPPAEAARDLAPLEGGMTPSPRPS
jgi:class 3 adenylate cyclase